MRNVFYFRYFYLFLFLLFIVGAILYYQTKISPIKQQEAKIEQQLNQTEVEPNTSTLSASKKSELTGKANMLQEKLPVEPLVSNFLIDLEKAETFAQVNITNITVTDPTKEKSTTSGSSNTTTGNSDTTTNTSSTQTAGTTETPAASNVTGEDATVSTDTHLSITLPEGVQEQTITITLQARSYENFYHFIQQIEQLKRLTAIQSMSYTVSDTTVDTFTVGISIFYDDKLKEELKSSIPYLETPKTSGKFDPLQNKITAEQDSINKDQ